MKATLWKDLKHKNSLEERDQIKRQAVVEFNRTNPVTTRSEALGAEGKNSCVPTVVGKPLESSHNTYPKNNVG